MYPSNSAPDLECSVCTVPIFRACGLTDALDSIPVNIATQKLHKPVLVTPMRPISEQLESFINQLGIEEALDGWRKRKPSPGKLYSMADGKIWQEIKGHDGRPFFENGDDRPDANELRIALTMNFDGFVDVSCAVFSITHCFIIHSFSFERSHHTGSHSSGVLSNSCANLPNHLRCVMLIIQ